MGEINWEIFYLKTFLSHSVSIQVWWIQYSNLFREKKCRLEIFPRWMTSEWVLVLTEQKSWQLAHKREHIWRRGKNMHHSHRSAFSRVRGKLVYTRIVWVYVGRGLFRGIRQICDGKRKTGGFQGLRVSRTDVRRSFFPPISNNGLFTSKNLK